MSSNLTSGGVTLLASTAAAVRFTPFVDFKSSRNLLKSKKRRRGDRGEREGKERGKRGGEREGEGEKGGREKWKVNILDKLRSAILESRGSVVGDLGLLWLWLKEREGQMGTKREEKEEAKEEGENNNKN